MQNLKNHGSTYANQPSRKADGVSRGYGATGYADVADDPWLASDTDALQLDARFDALGPAIARRPTVFYLCYPCDPWSGKLVQLG
jgi:hypothetical protein